jgi:hypothetical protein
MDTTTVETKSAPKPKILPAKKTEAKPAAAPNGEAKAVSYGKYSAADIIVVLAQTNPKKVGSKSHARFELYGGYSGHKTTVAEAIATGIFLADLPWDSDRKFIKIVKP